MTGKFCIWDAKKRSLVALSRWSPIAVNLQLQTVRARKSGRIRQVVVKRGGRKTQVSLYINLMNRTNINSVLNLALKMSFPFKTQINP